MHSTFLSAQVASISGTAPRWLSEPPHDHPQRTVRSDRLLASWWSTLSLSRSGVAWSAPCQAGWSPWWTALRKFTSPLSHKCASSVNQRRPRTALRTTAPSSHSCSSPLVSASDELVSCMDGGAGLCAGSCSVRSFLVRDFERGALQTSPGYPGRTTPPFGGYPLSRPSEFCRYSFFLRNNLSPRNSLFHLYDGGIIWCQVSLSVIPAEFSEKQLAGLIKRFAGNVRFHAKRPIHVRMHHKCFSFALILFAMFQTMHMTSFGKIGARAVKNELKWWVPFFRTPCKIIQTHKYCISLESQWSQKSFWLLAIYTLIYFLYIIFF